MRTHHHPLPWPGHWLDRTWVRLQPTMRIFEEGWGDEAVSAALSEQAAGPPVPEPAAVTWDGPGRTDGPGLWREGQFPTPLLADFLPRSARNARFALWLPHDSTPDTPVVLHLGGVGDEGYWLRRRFARPLLRRGVGAAILENPFYGARRPPEQSGVALRRVSDQLALIAAAVAEGCALLAWLGAQGYRRLGVTGYSMGGYTAGLIGSFFRQPIAVASCATGLTAAPVFTEGLLSRYIAWDQLGPDREAAKRQLTKTLDLGALARFEPPVRREAAVLLAGRLDGYVPADSVVALQEHWPGSHLRWLPGGHISSFFTKRRAICAAITESLSGLSVGA